MELSREGIAKAIRSNLSVNDAAAEIWSAVEAQIVESENRIINAEFALQLYKTNGGALPRKE